MALFGIIGSVVTGRAGRWKWSRWSACACLPAGSCDPIINVEGSFFPAWMLCIIVGIALAALIRPLFVRLGIETYLGPLPLIYASLALLLTLLTWLVLFRT
jgi:hypothetical protein